MGPDTGDYIRSYIASVQSGELHRDETWDSVPM